MLRKEGGMRGEGEKGSEGEGGIRGRGELLRSGDGEGEGEGRWESGEMLRSGRRSDEEGERGRGEQTRGREMLRDEGGSPFSSICTAPLPACLRPPASRPPSSLPRSPDPPWHPSLLQRGTPQLLPLRPPPRGRLHAPSGTFRGWTGPPASSGAPAMRRTWQQRGSCPRNLPCLQGSCECPMLGWGPGTRSLLQ